MLAVGCWPNGTGLPDFSPFYRAPAGYNPGLLMNISTSLDDSQVTKLSAALSLHRNFLTMSVIVILLTVSVAIAAVFLAAYLWSVSRGQFEDDVSPASRILFEDEPLNK